MTMQSAVGLFLVLMLALGLLTACPQTSTSTGGGGNDLTCTNGCYCPSGCGQLYKCSTPSCGDTFCCCTGGGCGRCGCS